MFFSFIVLAILLAGFIYLTHDKTVTTKIFYDRPIVVLILLFVSAFMVIRMFSSVFVLLFGITLPVGCKSFNINIICVSIVKWNLVIVVHATIRKPTFQDRIVNTIENFSLQTTPMGILLSWLGTKSNKDWS